MTLIDARELSKSYGEVRALVDVGFEIGAGEVVALLGRNGAGKTTTIELLLGLRSPDGGAVTICGAEPTSVAARGRIGAMPQHTGFPDSLRVRELIELAAAHYEHPQDVATVLASFELTALADDRVGSLSGGQQRRVALALAFVGNAPVVMLDEPSTGLDVGARRALWEHIRAAADDTRCVLFTTHYLEEAEALATRILVIDRGRMLFDGTPQAFRARFGARRLEYVAPSGERTVVTADDTDAYVRELVASGAPFRDLIITQSSFEDVFLDLVGGAV